MARWSFPDIPMCVAVADGAVEHEQLEQVLERTFMHRPDGKSKLRCTQGTKFARDITAPRPDAYVGPWQDRATRRAAARRRGRIRRPSRSGHNTTLSAPS